MAECVRARKCDKAKRTYQVDSSSAADDEAEGIVVQAILVENECGPKGWRNTSTLWHSVLCMAIAHQVIFNPFVHKSLQNYNNFVWTVTRLNGNMNYSLAAVRLPIRKPGPHNSRGSVGPLKWWRQSGFALKKLSSILSSLFFFFLFFFQGTN